MTIWSTLIPELQTFLLSAAADGAGGLAAGFADALLRYVGSRVREHFRPPPRQEALERAAGAAIAASVADWQLAHADYADLWQKFGAWLLNPAVLSEFRLLLTPSADATFDVDLLRDEFTAAGLEIGHLGEADFDALLQDLVAGFYVAAADEPELQEPLKIGLLRQMADSMGALTRLAQRQNRLGRQTVGQLTQLNQVADRIAEGHDETNLLLREIKLVLQERPQGFTELQELYEQIWQVLSRANLSGRLETEIGDGAHNVAVGQNIQMTVHEHQADLEQVRHLLEEIRDSLMARQSGLTSADLLKIEQRYRKSLVDQFELLTFRHISPTARAISLKLAEIYVELKAVADVPDADRYSADELRLLDEAENQGRSRNYELMVELDALGHERRRTDARQRQANLALMARRAISEVLADLIQRALVILGDPGAGKTTLLHYLALTHAQETPGGVLPIFVPLAAYDDHLQRQGLDVALADFLAIYYDLWRNQAGLAPLFQTALTQGRAVVLLDGLDEVRSASTRQLVAQQAEALMRQWQGVGNRFVLTSRVVGYREAPLGGNLPHVTVLDFGISEIERFAHPWCLAYEIWAAHDRDSPVARRQANDEERGLLNDVRSNPHIELLAANPLLLTMSALLRRQGGKLPDHRIRLYEDYVRALLENREQARSLGARLQDTPRFNTRQAESYLIQLGFWYLQHHAAGTARQQDLETALIEICLGESGYANPQKAPPRVRQRAQDEANLFLRNMRHIAGLLAERGRDAFGFLHLTFQEYFAGRALAKLEVAERWQLIQRHLHHPRWREPILLCASWLGLREQRTEWVNALVQQILQTPSPHETILQRDVFFAAAIAADDVGMAAALLDQIGERLHPLRTSAIPTIQQQALHYLAQLARLRCDNALQRLRHDLADPALTVPVLRQVGAVLGEPTLLQLRVAVRKKLDDSQWNVRQAAVQALSGLIPTDGDLQVRLLPWLGAVASNQANLRPLRQRLAAIYGLLISEQPTLYKQVVAWLDDCAWPLREGAAWALLVMPGGVPGDLLPKVRNLLNDLRSERRWPARLQMAELLLNDRNAGLRQQACTTALAALDYGRDPWYCYYSNEELFGPTIRQRAATILGQLKPLYYDEQVFTRLARVLNEDQNAQVRDAAYGALLRLAAAPEAPG